MRAMASGVADDSAYAARVRAALEVNLQQALAAELIDAADPAAGVRFPVRGLAVTPAGALHGGRLTPFWNSPAIFRGRPPRLTANLPSQPNSFAPHPPQRALAFAPLAPLPLPTCLS